MNQWQTPVKINTPPFSIPLGAKFYNAGSCFSDNITHSLKNNLFYVNSSPYGIEYNLVSIGHGLEKILNNYQFSEQDIIHSPQGFTTFNHHKLVFQKYKKEFLDEINNQLKITKNSIETADFFCVTPGTAYVYFEKSTNKPVNNCHKMPQANFERKLCNINDTCKIIFPVLSQIKNINPKIKFIFSLSPVKHLRDDATQNSLSKSVCRIAIDEIINHFGKDSFYFPAFEIVTDELRDYRYYDKSMTHPSQETIEFIQNKFFQNILTSEAKEFVHQWQNILSFINHKPLNPNSEDSQNANFVIKERINSLKNAYPKVNWDYAKSQILPLGLI